MNSPQMAFRAPPEIKRAIEKAASAESHTASALVLKVVSDWLVANGYLSKQTAVLPIRLRKKPAREA